MKEQHTESERAQGTNIGWSGIHSRMAAAQEAITGGTIRSPEEMRAVLRARARALAQEQAKEAGPQESLEVIEFRLAAESYGISSAFVREVYPIKDLTRLPGTPAFVLGIINVRGRILSIVDLRVFFNLPQKGLGDLNKVIILSDERMEFGILADVVVAMDTIVLEAIQHAPLTIKGIGDEYLKGVTDRGVIILDAERILGDARIVVNHE